VIALALVLLAGAEVDLDVRALPVVPDAPGLAMREKAAVSAATATTTSTATSTATQQATPFPGLTTPASEPPQDAEVHYRLNLGYGVDSARSTGVSAANGFQNPNPTLFRSYLFGDVAFGARGLPVPSLDTYFAANYYYDFLGVTQNSPFTTVYDRSDANARALLVRSAYAELDPASHGGAPFFLRAGRQFRLGAGIAHFDGATFGYDDSRVEVSGFVGQRVALYVDERTGPVGGGALRVHLDPLLHVPVDGSVELLGFDGDLYTDITLHAAGAHGSALFGARLFGQDLGDLFLRTRLLLSKHLTVIADGEQRFDEGPLYDYVTGAEPPGGAKVFGLRFFSLPQPQSFTRLRFALGLDPVSQIEILAYGLGVLVEGSRPETDPWPSRTGFDQSYGEVGGLVDWRPGQGLTLLAGYHYREYLRQNPNDMPRLDDPGSAGEVRSHELLVDGRYSLGPRRLTVSASAYVREYDLQNPAGLETSVKGDVRGGLRFDVESWLLGRVRFKATYEIADPSPIFSTDLDTLQSIRVIAEAVF
jgi:hypothetical protein